ncbi:hypothetical protein AVEN_233346-1, partial [Araneus ventricosus]
MCPECSGGFLTGARGARLVPRDTGE